MYTYTYTHFYTHTHSRSHHGLGFKVREQLCTCTWCSMDDGLFACTRTDVYGPALKSKTPQAPKLQTHRSLEILAVKAQTRFSKIWGCGDLQTNPIPFLTLIPHTEKSPCLHTEAFALGNDSLRELVAGLLFFSLGLEVWGRSASVVGV